MLKTLLASGALLQGLKATIADRVRRTAVMAACGVVALVFVSIALMAFAVAGAVALEPYLGAAGAIAVVGAVFALVGVAVLLIGMRQASPPKAAAPAPPPKPAADLGLEGLVGQGGSRPPLSWLLGAAALGFLLGRRD
jgi:hypothetical protein